jgi:hypothetical protein
MRTFLMFLFSLSLSMSGACADEIVFKSDSEIMIVRGRQTMDFAIYEVLGPRNGEIQCVALDAHSKPIAVSGGYVEHGAVMFLELNIKDVHQVVCKYQG